VACVASHLTLNYIHNDIIIIIIIIIIIVIVTLGRYVPEGV